MAIDYINLFLEILRWDKTRPQQIFKITYSNIWVSKILLHWVPSRDTEHNVLKLPHDVFKLDKMNDMHQFAFSQNFITVYFGLSKLLHFKDDFSSILISRIANIYL